MSNTGCMATCKLHGTGKKPQRCVEYPQQHDHLLPKCTYSFENGQRVGTCQPNVCQEQNCCNVPRAGGEPEGVTQDLLAGGLPCKHLEWHFVDEPVEKNASDNEEYEEYNRYRTMIYKALSGDL